MDTDKKILTAFIKSPKSVKENEETEITFVAY